MEKTLVFELKGSESLICKDFLRVNANVKIRIIYKDDSNLGKFKDFSVLMVYFDGAMRSLACEKSSDELLKDQDGFAQKIKNVIKHELGIDIEININAKLTPIEQYDPNNRFDQVALNTIRQKGISTNEAQNND